MNITVVGTGYVGLVAGACFAETGHDVMCVDVDEKKIAALKRSEIPIYEPGLGDLVQRNVEESRLKFSTSLKDGVEFGEVIFIAVGTPQDASGSADLSQVLEVAKGIGKYMNGPKTIVDKSTVPVGTAEIVRKTIARVTSHKFDVVSNPEFLKEGAAIEDFMKPDRVVLGVSNGESERVMRELYSPFVRTNNPILVMDVVSAEMTKYAANTMLAIRVSFMNEIANLCEKVGADIDAVRIGIGSDSRIGMSFLFPGIGYGGSCFPKDVQALIKTGRDHETDLKIPVAAEKVNEVQKRVIVDKIRNFYGKGKLSGKKFAIWGLTFKPRTDDVREAPALVVCRALIDEGASLKAFDPEGIDNFRLTFGEDRNITYSKTNYEAVEGVDALIVCTEWNEFRRPNFQKLKTLMTKPVIFDGRNIFDLRRMEALGFVYHCIGRPSVGG